MKSIKDYDFELIESDYNFNYQENLTHKLDNNLNDFCQKTINEIVLWKVNRYAELSKCVLNQINQIKKTDTEINIEFTRDLILNLLKIKGIGLPMASTILRFKNPNLYQIIDQRVYRIIYYRKLKIPTKHEDQVILYINYLNKIRLVSETLSIPFELTDRILFLSDKRLNKGVILKNY